MKGTFPFRLGTSSYIIPDEILPNIQYLKDLVDDVEIVLFESDEYSNIPSPALAGELKAIREEAELSYTIHLPLDTELGSADEEIRQESVDKCLRIIDRMSSVDPFAYVLHLHGDKGRRGKTPSDDMNRWRDQSKKSVASLVQDSPSNMFCIETLDYPFDLVEDIPQKFGTSICLDIGHVLLCGYDLKLYYQKYLDSARIIHLHGIKDGVDHSSISFLRIEVLRDLIERLSKKPTKERVLTLEIFSEADFLSSMEVLRFLKERMELKP
jgi:sugar phosphate isomerase/epimerase